MAKAANDYTKMMKDMMGSFPVDMTAMQDVEHAIGEDQRSGQLPDRWCQVGGCDDLLFETHRHVADQRRRCVISDTFITSPKNSRQLASEADCVASSAAAP